jgi:hypothetical protein
MNQHTLDLSADGIFDKDKSIGMVLEICRSEMSVGDFLTVWGFGKTKDLALTIHKHLVLNYATIITVQQSGGEATVVDEAKYVHISADDTIYDINVAYMEEQLSRICDCRDFGTHSFE